MSHGLTVDQDAGQWRQRAPGERVYLFVTEYSKSSRARCRLCSEKIPKDEIRCGTPVAWRGGDFGYINSWAHLKCTRTPDGFECTSKEIWGLENLSKEDQTLVLAEVKKKGLPSHIKTIDPNDPDFLKKRKLKRVKAAKTVTANLLPYQEEGLGWMLSQENETQYKGGILADEMGMGKTIQTIALICNQHLSKKKDGKMRPTLIVTPSSALLQWQAEIERFTTENALKVFVFHSKRKGITPSDLLDYDVVLTSYPICEYEFRRVVDQQKIECNFCGKKYLPSKLGVHKKYFCKLNPEAKRTAKQALQERSGVVSVSTKKAMRTLRITKGSSVPTPTAIYNELMAEANRKPLSQFDKGKARREKKKRKSGDEVVEEDSPSTPAPVQRGVSPTQSATRSPMRKIEKDEEDEEENTNLCVAKLLSMFGSRYSEAIITEMSLAAHGDVDVATNLLLDMPTTRKLHTPSPSSGDDSDVIEVSSPYFSKENTKKKRDLEQSPYFDKSKKRKSEFDENDYRCIGNMAVQEPDKSWRRVVVFRDKSDPDRVVIWFGKNEFEGLGEEKYSFDETRTILLDSDGDRIECKDFVPDKKSKTETTKTIFKRGDTVMARWQGGSFFPATVMSRNKNDGTYRLKYDDGDVENYVDPDDVRSESFVPPPGSSKNNRKSPEIIILDDSDESDFKPDDDDDVDDIEKTPKRKKVKRRTTSSVNRKKTVDVRKSAKTTKKKTTTKKKVSKKKTKKASKKKKKKKSSTKKKAAGDESSDSDDDLVQKGKGKKRKKSKDLDSSSSSSSEVDEEIQIVPVDAFNDEEKKHQETLGYSLSESVLHCIRFNRIILDEAHKIKGRTSSTAQAVFSLRSDHKWCLTGTPLQNRVGELYALIRFLRMDPFAYYFCKVKGCTCRSLQWNFGKQQRRCTKEGCNHPPMSHFSYFNKHILNPIKRYGYIGDGRRGMLTLKNEVLEKVMLRRTKKEKQKEMKLPELTISVEKLKLSTVERDFYECIYKQTKSKYNAYVNKGTVLHNFAHIFELLSRLRQAVDHPYMVVHRSENDAFGSLPSKSAGGGDVCGICLEDIDLEKEKCAVSGCKHIFHRRCMMSYAEKVSGNDASKKGDSSKKKAKVFRSFKMMDKTCPTCYQPLQVTMDLRGLERDENKKAATCVVCLDRPRDVMLLPCGHVHLCQQCVSALPSPKRCPMCRASISKTVKISGNGSDKKKKSMGRDTILQKLNMSQWVSSTKIEALVQSIKSMPKGSKAIAFSQYTTFLDLCNWRLKRAGIHCCMLMGHMPLTQRKSTLNAFKTDPTIKVILMSLKAGGEGLNLQEASHVFLLDPWWNPAVEMQAIQRAHRIGTKHPVKAVRFITSDTIEDRMNDLQKVKMKVFEGAIDSSAAALSSLSVEDIRFLFR